MALKMGVCLSVASFAHLAMTGILKGMEFRATAFFLVRSFSAARKRMNIRGRREYSLYSKSRKKAKKNKWDMYYNLFKTSLSDNLRITEGSLSAYSYP